MHLSTKVKIYPTKQQLKFLWGLSDKCCSLYNLALAERKDAWKLGRKNVKYIDQQNKLSEFKKKNPEYKVLPPYRSDCISGNSTVNSMELIYPKSYAKIYVPLEIDGSMGKTIFQVAHRRPQTTIYWHLDGEYLGMTTEFHQMELSPSKGVHTLTLVDQYGESLIRKFEILGK